MTTADGVEISVCELGARRGPALVMAHATGFCGKVLTPLAMHLGEQFWPVSFDQRGHGSSGVPPEGPVGWRRWDWQGFGLDVLAVVDWIDGGAPRRGRGEPREPTGRGRGEGGGPFGFGHSCGGAVLLLAEIARPGTFRAIYAFEPIVFRPPPREVLDQASPLAELTRRRREVFGSAAEAYANFAHQGPFADFDPAALAAYLECGFDELADGAVRLACRREHEAFIYEAGLAHDAWDHLGEISCPVTVAYGRHSEVIDEADARELASRLPAGQVELVDGVGHFGPMERPPEVGASLAAALARQRPRQVHDPDTALS